MIVAGLLSSQSEAQEIQYIMKICVLEERIRYIVRRDTIKRLLMNDAMSECDDTKH